MFEDGPEVVGVVKSCLITAKSSLMMFGKLKSWFRGKRAGEERRLISQNYCAADFIHDVVTNAEQRAWLETVGRDALRVALGHSDSATISPADLQLMWEHNRNLRRLHDALRLEGDFDSKYRD
jgi:hypothetical protein